MFWVLFGAKQFHSLCNRPLSPCLFHASGFQPPTGKLSQINTHTPLPPKPAGAQNFLKCFSLRNPANVVCLRDSHTTERRILIVLEFCGGGDLGQFIHARGPSPESTARLFMLQLAAGLAFLRSKRLIHRDIKPQNLLLSEESPRAILKVLVLFGGVG